MIPQYFPQSICYLLIVNWGLVGSGFRCRSLIGCRSDPLEVDVALPPPVVPVAFPRRLGGGSGRSEEREC